MIGRQPADCSARSGQPTTPLVSDAELLERFVSQRDECAFAALMARHGPMVWGVCRRVLGNDHDAEDAFQAAFRVLVRKAASIVPRERVANFLYGVARQTAVKARAIAVRRKAREKQVENMPESAVVEQDGPHDLLSLLDQELSRLPDKYRTAIVLCDLEGKTYKEASRQLDCPEGTLSARLARGRTLLAKRLSRHGLKMAGGMLTALLAREAAACVPPSVVSSTIKVLTLFAAGQAAATGAISVKVAALTEGVLRTMLLTKLKAVMVLLTVAALSGTAGSRRAPNHLFSSPGRVRVTVTWGNPSEQELQSDEETIAVLAPAGVEDDLQRMYAPPIQAPDIAEYQTECRKKGGYAAVGRGRQVVIENVKPGTYCLVVISTRKGISNSPAYIQRTNELMKPYFNSIPLRTTSAGVAMHHVEVIQVRGGKETAVSPVF